MINNNKILTVSYGTFSCTLEGFDDSFGTMKAIAEYFRDLSADDRYFGAEPVQPDAQMLARIAQREISRHVEAREDDGQIVLSAQNTPQSAALVATAVVDDVADAVAEAAAAKAHEEDAKAASSVSEPVIEATDDGDVTQTADAQPVESVQEDADDTPEVTAAEEPVEPAEVDAPEAQSDIEAENDIVPSLPDSDVEAFFAESTTPTDSDFTAVEDDMDAEDAPEQERAKADSIAEKLKRIRAVVSQQSATTVAPDYSEDQHADGAAAQDDAAMASVADAIEAEDTASQDTPAEDAQNDVIADTLRDLEEALDADDALEVSDDIETSTASEEDDIAAILNRLEREGDAEMPRAIEEDQDDDDLDDDILAAMDSLVAETDDEDLDDLGDDNLFDAEQDVAADTQPSEPEADAAVAPQPRTRVLKVKRATLEAAIEAGKLEEYEEDEVQAQSGQPPKAPLAERSSLTDEAEEELARELAELEADMEAKEAPAQTPEAEEAADTVAVDTAQDDDGEEMVTPAGRADIHGSADEDLSRLMQETDSQMDEPEGATRRDAFAHLRAAVAAKKADEAVGGDSDDEDTDEAYRDDLANVVRPRRPVAGERPRTERPAEQRPAPLKLVAEQRIDVDENRSAAPVRPRRVAAVVSQPVSSASPEAASFADFAADVGADKLPDLLEAAAAYLSFVEGHEEFSRPQLMTKVRQVEKENFTREDSLRSFGKLLREGKIEKLKGGRFQASDQIGYKPEARAAG